MGFRPATRSRRHARVALQGPAGSGKTFTALRLAHGLLASRDSSVPAGQVAVIDSEHGSADDYADRSNPDTGAPFTFDVLDLNDRGPGAKHSAERYLWAIEQAWLAGYGALIIDSLSHLWMGDGGILQIVDSAKSSFGKWKEASPLLRSVVDAILNYPGHVIVTMRTKSAWAVELNDKGKHEPRRIGTEPVMRDGIEYEFTIGVEMESEPTDGGHQAVGRILKTRCERLPIGTRFVEPGACNMGVLLSSWLASAKHVWHPSWGPAEAAFRRDLAAFGLTVEQVDLAMEAKGKRPTCTWEPETRERLIKGLEKGTAWEGLGIDPPSPSDPADAGPPELDEAALDHAAK